MGGIVSYPNKCKKSQYDITINGGDIFEGNLGPFPFASDNMSNLSDLKLEIINHIYSLDYLYTYLTNNYFHNPIPRIHISNKTF